VVVSKALVGRTADHWGFDALKPPERGKALTITDSWAGDVVSAAALLHTVAEGARELGCQWVRLNCRRSDTLARLCVLAGGELRWSAAQERDCFAVGEDVDAFYLANLHLAIEQLLPELDARWRAFSGAAPPTVRLDMEGEGVGLHLGRRLQVLDDPGGAAAVIRLPRKAMTRALLGYATPTELSLLHKDCCVPDECQAAADALFSAREPRPVHEGWAFAQMADYGLVP